MILYCSNCGKQIDLNANFCQNCGTNVGRLDARANPSDDKHSYETLDERYSNKDLKQTYDSSNNHDHEQQQIYSSLEHEQIYESNFEEDLLIYVGKNAHYYDQKWETAEVKGNSWNWAGFFLSTGWLGYRKMYKEVLFIALFFLLVDLLLYAVDAMYGISGSFLSSINSSLSIGLAAFVGIYGNKLYKNHSQKNVMEIRNIEQDARRREFLLKQKGGTSWGGVFGAIGIMIVFYVIPAIFIPFDSETIDAVKGGTFYDYPDVTVENLFDTVFEDTSWEVIPSDFEYDLVEFNGTKVAYDYDFFVQIQFYYDGDEFEVFNIVVDHDELEDYEILEFLDFIFTEYESYD